MKHACVFCERTAIDRNLWCPEKECPLASTEILSYGIIIGDTKIINVVNDWRNATLYVGERKGKKVYIKVAKPNCEEPLKREANLLKQIYNSRSKKYRSRQLNKRQDPFPSFPRLLSPFEQADLQHYRPYGIAVRENQELHYIVFEYFDAVVLSQWLNQNPQPWFEHVIYIIDQLASAISVLHASHKKLHLMLNPNIVLVRFDLEGYPRPILFDLGTLEDAQALIIDEVIPYLQKYAYAAYAPKPLVLETNDNANKKEVDTYSLDIYGLALMAEEMLIGQKRFTNVLQREDAIRTQVRLNKNTMRVRRPDIPNHSKVADYLAETINYQYSYQSSKSKPDYVVDARVFALQLLNTIGLKRTPSEQLTSKLRRRIIRGFIFALIILLIIVLYFLLASSL